MDLFAVSFFGHDEVLAWSSSGEPPPFPDHRHISNRSHTSVSLGMKGNVVTTEMALESVGSGTNLRQSNIRSVNSAWDLIGSSVLFLRQIPSSGLPFFANLNEDCADQT